MDIQNFKLHDFDLSGQKVFLRADLNVPLSKGKIVDDFRLKKIMPTINLIQQKGGRVILATHLGRPKKYTPELSTRVLIPWFNQQGYTVHFEENLDNAAHVKFNQQHDILLLENLRFFSGEKDGDPAFAQKLFQLADYYVNDAFAVLHRQDTSITLLPKLYQLNKKSFGLLVEEELNVLSQLKDTPQEPFIVIVGGGKVRDKLPFLYALLGKADALLLCPAIVFTFLKAQGVTIGKSLVDEEATHKIEEFMYMAAQKGTRLVFPVDYQIAHDSFNGPLAEVAAGSIPNNGIGLSIGKKTEAVFAQELSQAKTIFFNGLPGLWNRPKTLAGAHTILELMAQSDAFTVIGGGDSVGAAHEFNLASEMSFCSTGGGATLAYLAGEMLPGIRAMR